MNTRVDKINLLVELEKQNDSIEKIIYDLKNEYNRRNVIDIRIDEGFNEDVYSKKTKRSDLDVYFNKHYFLKLLTDQKQSNDYEIGKLIHSLYGEKSNDK